jgi:hypothetical protein
MRDLCGARQWELQPDARNCTDPMNSDMAAKCGYQNCEKERRKAKRKEKEGGLACKSERAKSRVEDTIVVGWEKGLAGQLLARWVRGSFDLGTRNHDHISGPLPHVHVPPLSPAMSTAGATDGLNDVYEALERYNWNDDVEFQAGLNAILGSNSTPEQATELALRARCFYYARCVRSRSKKMQRVDSQGPGNTT